MMHARQEIVGEICMPSIVMSFYITIDIVYHSYYGQYLPINIQVMLMI